MSSCHNCNAYTPADASFCTRCGSSLETGFETNSTNSTNSPGITPNPFATHSNGNGGGGAYGHSPYDDDFEDYPDTSPPPPRSRAPVPPATHAPSTTSTPSPPPTSMYPALSTSASNGPSPSFGDAPPVPTRGSNRHASPTNHQSPQQHQQHQQQQQQHQQHSQHPQQYIAIPMPVSQRESRDRFGRKKHIPAELDRFIIQTNAKASAAIEGLKKYYSEFIRPLEIEYRFSLFHSPPWSDVDFDAAPMVLLLGQYSTGKTSFINYLIEKDFANMRIGPEPTTDRFTAIMYGTTEQVIPGNAAASATTMPFLGLQKFGMSFLNRFETALCNSPVLQQITFIDTPGVLSGEKQRVNRQYNFTEVIEWFAERADRIILLFDAHKLDISDEFKESIEVLNGMDEKIRCILNKADSIPAQALMRVYGALMWSLGKVFKSPEVVRVYTGSFWAQPLQDRGNQEVLLQEEADLLADLRSLPRSKAIRRLNDMVKRCRQVRTHALIMEHLRSQFSVFGKKKKREALLGDLVNVFKAVQRKHSLPAGDFPHIGKFRELAKDIDIWSLPSLNHKAIDRLNWVLEKGIAELIRMIPSINERESSYTYGRGGNEYNPSTSTPLSPSSKQGYPNGNGGGNGYDDESRNSAGSSNRPISPSGANGLNPFAEEENNTPIGWSIDESLRKRWIQQFYTLKLMNGKLTGAAAKPILLQSNLSPVDLRKVWTLADMDKDGNLDQDEYIIAQYTIMQKNNGTFDEIPYYLPQDIIPPSKRHLSTMNGQPDIEGSSRY